MAMLLAFAIAFGSVAVPRAGADDHAAPHDSGSQDGPPGQGERSQRDHVQQQKADAATKLDELHATDQQLEQAVATLDQNLVIEQAKVADAARSAEQGRQTAGRLAEELARAQTAVSTLRDQVRTRTLNEYVQPDDDDFVQILQSRDAGQVELRRAINGSIAKTDAQVLDQLQAARRNADSGRQQADRAHAVAVARQAELEAEQRGLKAARQQQAQARQALAARISEYQQEVGALAAQEDQLTSIIQMKVAEDEAKRQAEAAFLAALTKQAEAARVAGQAQQAAADQAAIAAANAPAPAATPVRSLPPGSISRAGLVFPAGGPITSGFGYRWGALHPGIDIGAPFGSPIWAARAGTVIFAGWMNGYGNFVMIDHGGGFVTAYGHQSRIATSMGQQVVQGQVIGYVGSTGYSTGPHLHFETRVNGTPVDPMQFL